MLVYGNKTVQKAWYGDKKIYRAYIGDKLVFNYDFFWKNPYNNYLLYDGTLINYTDEGGTVINEGVNDVSLWSNLFFYAKDTGLYKGSNLLYDGKWSRLSYCHFLSYVGGTELAFRYIEGYGIVDGEAAAYLSIYQVLDASPSTPTIEPTLIKCNERTKKLYETYALTESGNLLFCSLIYTEDGIAVTGAEWIMRDSSVVDLCENAYLKQDGGIYTLSGSLVTTIDSTDVKSFEQGFIVDGFINKLSGSALNTSNIGGFTAASYNIAIKDGVLFDISDLSNVVAIPDAPDNFVEVSRYAGRTDDNRIFQWKDGALKELILENAE